MNEKIQSIDTLTVQSLNHRLLNIFKFFVFESQGAEGQPSSGQLHAILEA